jgi:hypothetical protein
VRLWIKVNDQHSLALFGKGSGKIHRRGGFAASTFLVRYDYRSHSTPVIASRADSTISSMYLDGGLPSRGASQPNKQYPFSPGHKTIDFSDVFLLEKYRPAPRPPTRGQLPEKAPRIERGFHMQKKTGKTIADGISTDCPTQKYQSPSTSRPAFSAAPPFLLSDRP